MNQRTEQLRRAINDARPRVCAERAGLITEAYRRTEGFPASYRRAHAFRHILENMRIYIQEGELIVGNLATSPRAAPVYPEFSIRWLIDELETMASRKVDPFLVLDGDAATLREIAPYWTGITHEDYCRRLIGLSLEPRYAELYKDVSLNQITYNPTNLSGGQGHVIPDHEGLLRSGLASIMQEAAAEVTRLDHRKRDFVSKKLFLESLITTCQAAIDFARRCSECARELSRRPGLDDTRRREYEKIAANCAKVPAQPADTFWEALQFVWFIHLLIHVESNGHGVSLGRLDQFLLPYYRREVAAGTLDEARAQELLECFWIKCCELNKVRTNEETQFKSGYPMFQTISLGNVDAQERDTSNELSTLCLRVTADLKLPMPTVVVMMSRSTSTAFLLEAVRALREYGGGMPSFFNASVGMKALLARGASLEEAGRWAVDSCCEIQVPGKSTSYARGTLYVNMGKLVEVTLNGGINPATGGGVLPTGSSLRHFESYDALYQALKDQIRAYLKAISILDVACGLSYHQHTPTPFLSAVMDDSIAFCADVSGPGRRSYDNTIIEFQGLITAANSLAALRKLLFEEKRLDASEIETALRENFAGQRGAEIRAALLEAPKYGNDDDYADQITADLLTVCLDDIEQYQASAGGHFGGTLLTITANVPMGKVTGATPDGRHAGEPLADNITPQKGTALRGPTAVLRSAAKLDHARLINGSVLNLTIHPFAINTDGGLVKFVNLIRGYGDEGGYQVQFNVHSAETLRKAQKDPDEYRDLVVKVSGYSARFVELDPIVQEEIIARIENML